MARKMLERSSMKDRWTAGIEPVNGAGNIYANLIDTFAAVLPEVSPAKLDATREVARLLARSIVCADRVVDGDVPQIDQVESVLAAQVCQLDATRLLQTLVPSTHPVWDEISVRLREFAAACADEADARAVLGISIAAAERIAIGKNALARITGPLVCAMGGGDAALAAAFDHAVHKLIVTVQALDDAMDWRGDLAAGRISLITVRIRSLYDDQAPMAEVARFVHGSAMGEVLRQGQAALVEAAAIPQLRGSIRWLNMTDRIADGYGNVMALLR